MSHNPPSDTALEELKVYHIVCEDGIRRELVSKADVLKHTADREKAAENKLWGQTYNFLYPRDKELCQEWDGYIIVLNEELNAPQKGSE